MVGIAAVIRESAGECKGGHDFAGVVVGKGVQSDTVETKVGGAKGLARVCASGAEGRQDDSGEEDQDEHGGEHVGAGERGKGATRLHGMDLSFS